MVVFVGGEPMISRDENGRWHTADADINDVVHALGFDVLSSFDDLPKMRHTQDDELTLLEEFRAKRKKFYSSIVKGS